MPRNRVIGAESLSVAALELSSRAFTATSGQA